ncbi:MAG: hypothetical protein A4E51_00808 [Methanosaeta sp. PtaU1.Bin055]|nr:MAG: hypothetical protein A4E51_00808 [Methanosaeta sp. PtaU1.Bin055]
MPVERFQISWPSKVRWCRAPEEKVITRTPSSRARGEEAIPHHWGSFSRVLFQTVSPVSASMQ